MINLETNTPHTTPAFNSFKLEDYLPTFKKLIKETKKEIDLITNNTTPPSFENTVEALDFSGEKLNRLSSIFFNLNSAETSPEMQKLAQEISPLLTSFSNDITLNKKLFKRIKFVFENQDKNTLTPEQKMLLNTKYKNFARNGALLNNEKKNEVRAIDTQLAQLKLQFGENILAETNAYQLHITKETDLQGLPESTKEAAASLAKKNNKKGWIFTLDFPSYIPFITYAANRKLRKKISIAYGKRAFKSNNYNNEDIIKKIVQLKQKRAVLLGYASHAHFVLEERMAQTPEKVTTFLNNLLEKAKPAAEKEFKQLSDFAKKRDGIASLKKWDGAYYSEKLKQKLFNLDDEKLKPYFQLENVVNGVFKIAKKLYNIKFTEATNITTYHKDVTAYEVHTTKNEFIGVFYTDFFPRKGKRNGAWMTSYKPQYIKNKINERPHISIVCNFTPPTATKPSLLTFNEVTTLFHEFGHALHGLLANTTYPSLSGTSVYWDFVELPSQILENWCYEPEALELFAKHYITNEIIPQEYVNKIKESGNFLEGMATLRQLSFGLLDMAYHTSQAPITCVKTFEKDVFSTTQLYPDVAENCMSTAFSHIFQGGYSAGYYSYKWAEVLDADAFAYFKENGIFNKEIASLFKDYILSKGGTIHPMELYKKFRGQEPKLEPLLKRAGLL